jgi:hypothetical protein
MRFEPTGDTWEMGCTHPSCDHPKDSNGFCPKRPIVGWVLVRKSGADKKQWMWVAESVVAEVPEGRVLRRVEPDPSMKIYMPIDPG